MTGGHVDTPRHASAALDQADLHGEPVRYSIADVFRGIMMWRPSGLCVVQGEVRLTYREVWDRSQRLAVYLQSLGVGRGDPLAYINTNDYRFVEILLAAARIGAVLTPVNIRLTADEIRYILCDSGTRVVMASDRYYRIVEEAAEGSAVSHLIALGELAPPGWESYDGGSGLTADELRELDSLAEEPIAILYTSGTTGFPKGCTHTHASLLAHAWRMIHTMRFSEDDVTFVVTPLFHMAGLNLTLPTLFAGGAVAMADSFDPVRLTAQLEQVGATCTLLVPTMVSLAIQHPSIGSTARLRTIMYGGSTMFMKTLIPAQHYFGCEFVQCYGMTEAATLTVLDARHHQPLPDGSEPPKLRSVGRPMIGCRVAIRRPDGSFADPGEHGEVVARGDLRARGYWRQPHKFAEMFADGWLATGDVGYLDADGFLYLVDRIKDMIIRKGENIYSAEVERVLSAHP